MKLFGKNKVGRNSIKESLDNLPSGVCFAKVNGVIVLQNHKMDALARELIGRDLQHLSELETALNKPNETVKLINPQNSLYLFSDNTVWQFSESNITDNSGCTYILIASYDVTELYRKEKELEKGNEELMEVNGRAKALYSQIEQIVKDEETLALKAKIHDDLGMELLNSRKLLSKEPTLEEMKQQGLRWEHIAKTLGSSEEEPFNKPPFSSYEELKELTNFAFNLGLSLNVYGEMPKDEQSAKLILAAIRECITKIGRAHV